MKKSILFGFLILIIFPNSCLKSPVNIDKTDTHSQFTVMDFNDLSEGDKFYFQKFYGDDYKTGEHKEYYYEDVFLKLEILKEYSKKHFLVSEVIYSRPIIEVDGEIIEELHYEAEEKVKYNYFYIEDEYLRVVSETGGNLPDSHIFRIPYLSFKEVRLKEIDIIGWKTSLPYSETDIEAFTLGLELNGFNYDTLNVFIKNFPLGFDSRGTTQIYSEKVGVVRYADYSRDEGFGWDRIFDLPF